MGSRSKRAGHYHAHLQAAVGLLELAIAAGCANPDRTTAGVAAREPHLIATVDAFCKRYPANRVGLAELFQPTIVVQLTGRLVLSQLTRRMDGRALAAQAFIEDHVGDVKTANGTIPAATVMCRFDDLTAPPLPADTPKGSEVTIKGAFRGPDMMQMDALKRVYHCTVIAVAPPR